MTQVQGWIQQLQLKVQGLARLVAQALSRIQALEQAARTRQTGPYNTGGGGSSTRAHWARVPAGGVGPAHGAWPAWTPQTFASDVYRDLGGGGLELAEAGATVYWRWLDGTTAGKLVLCLPNADGTYTAVVPGCTVIPEA